MSSHSLLLVKDDLEQHGYVEVDEHGWIKPGVRVRHVGEQYPEAYDKGTSVVLAVMHKPDSAWSQKYHQADLEIIVERDKPQFGRRITNWAHYQTERAYEQPKEASDEG